MRRLLCSLLAASLVASATPAGAFVPQTIVIDGVNDFDPSNLLDDDRNDTQTFCAPAALPLDLGRVYVTNDANFLYLGIEFAQTCFCDMNLGVSIDVNSAGGGTSDPFGRSIGWANVPNKPDWVVYDVTPTSCNSFNFEALYKDSLGQWLNRSSLVNPSYGSGSNGLGIADGSTFKEVRLPLSVLGAVVGTPLHLELWVTQEGATKGPLDALCGDAVQMSRVNQTTFDTTAVVQMPCQLTYTILSAVDNVAPTVSSANAVSFPLLANRQFAPGTNKIDVLFSEPVGAATSQVATNYTYSGPVTRSVISAVRDAAALNVVHLTLNTSISANAAFHNITVQNVQDAAGNPITANGTTNVGSFFIQNVQFEGNFKSWTCNGTFATADTFAVEGNVPPLDFTPINNALLYDADGDTIYTGTVPVPMVKSGASATVNLEWKFYRKTVGGTFEEYEPISGNRPVTLSSDNGASVVLAEYWANQGPERFLRSPVDVIFKVFAPGVGSSSITLLGNQAPLIATAPGNVAMLDNGVAPDELAGDRIYTARVTFPPCTFKDVDWRVAVDNTPECQSQGLRHVFLNDEMFSSANPIVLPARGLDACTVSDKDVTVVFRVDMTAADPNPIPSDAVALGGNVAPLDFGNVALNPMVDDGAGFDAAAGDLVYTRAVTFLAGSNLSVAFKHALNGVFECPGAGDRNLSIDDVSHSTGNPQIKVLSTWNFCTDPAGVGDPPTAQPGTEFAVLRQSTPNPSAGTTWFRFDLRRAGHVTLSVYDLVGRLVARPLDHELALGPHEVAWDGRANGGDRLRSGVYVYELTLGGERIGRRMVLTR